jgi:hypothetical protein
MKAKIAFYNLGLRPTWSVVYSNTNRISGVQELHPMPPVDCPVVVVPEAIAWTKYSAILARHIQPGKRLNKKSLITALTGLGCTVEDGATFQPISAYTFYPLPVRVATPLSVAGRRPAEDIVHELGF